MHRGGKECSNPPSEVNEGITELQWAQIESLPRNSQSKAEGGKRNLDVEKWNQIWGFLFPDEQLPVPCEYYFHGGKFNLTPSGHIPTTAKDRSRSLVDAEIEEFSECYDTFVKDVPEELSPKEKAMRAFRAWFVKRRMQQIEEGKSKLTIRECPGAQNTDSPMEEEQLNRSIPSQNLSRHTSLPHDVQTSSTDQEYLDMSSTDRAAPRPWASPDLPSQAPGQENLGSDPLTPNWGPNVAHLPHQEPLFYQQSMTQPLMYPNHQQLPDTTSDSTGFAPPLQQYVTTGDDAFDEFTNYSDQGQFHEISSSIDMSGFSQYEQNSAATFALPQSPLRLAKANQSQSFGVSQSQPYAPTPALTDNHVQHQQQNLPNAKPNSQRNFAPNMSNGLYPVGPDDLYKA